MPSPFTDRSNPIRTSNPYTPGIPGSSSVINSIPGMPGNGISASNIVSSQLGGMPGTSTARRANAYFGNASGVPGSDFVRNRGFDLYNQQGEQRQQQGIQNLLSMLQGFSQPKLQERGQNIQQSQFAAQFGQGQLESDRNYGLARDQFNASERSNNPYRGRVGSQAYTPGISPTPFGRFQEDPNYTRWLQRYGG